MQRWFAKLGRHILSSYPRSLPPFSSNPLPGQSLFFMRSINSSFFLCPTIYQSRISSQPFSPFFPVLNSRHFASESKKDKKKKKMKLSRAPRTPVVSKVKKYRLKAYSSFKYRFRTLSDGQIRRGRAGKNHNAHLKSKKSKRRLRKLELVYPAYAKVMKKLNFAG
ncbi:hypothetical protein HPP92_025234 [Vanilla planifolia]|uniref:50S ribosomal protein L35 n=1 Tax=Vanilla planifolia TaxID=51239 RepID=A0A835PK85_VANPL|nr:hypothetical protein HPP92_025490 [Vanilla planifolia]KAG0453930.1 hypothetical protein HPP92_025234 [Vanilla planifolia]